MIELRKVRLEDRELLWNINQKYLYEMTAFYDDEMDEKGNYLYGHFEEYFTDPAREALFIYCDGRLAGFAMVIPYSNIGQKPDFVMAEFTVFPAFRGKHVAIDVARMIFESHKGNWEVKYNEKNAPARSLWTKATAEYCPGKVSLNEDETVLVFSTN